MTVDQLVEYACHTAAASSQPQASSADPLSQREREVIALLARGYTNRQIAQELIISGRTADGHVAHILAKLGLSTRAQAAVWAVEHPLAGTPIYRGQSDAQHAPSVRSAAPRYLSQAATSGPMATWGNSS